MVTIRRATQRLFDRHLGELIEILLRQPQLLVIEPPRHTMVPTAIGEEVPRIHPQHQPRIIPTSQPRHPSLIPLLRPFLRDRPLLDIRLRDPQHRIQHILLAHDERRHIAEPVAEIGQACRRRLLVV